MSGPKRQGRPPYNYIITPHEWRVLALLRRGLTNREIAHHLGISLNGVKYHVSNMLSKLYLHDRKALSAWTSQIEAWGLVMEYMVPKDAMARGLAFVERDGSDLMKALAAQAAGFASGDDVLTHLLPYQNEDGGWQRLDSDMQGAISTISLTWVGLEWLLWSRPTDSDPLDRTIAFLCQRQHADGYWDEPEEILEHDPPPWMVPGNRANQLWLTSAVCCKLLELGRETEVRFEAALDFLRKGWEFDHFPVYQHTHWMAANLFGRLSEPTDLDQRIAGGSAKRLTDDLHAGTADPLDITSIAYAAHQSGARDLFDIAFPMVSTNQAEDGGWTTGYGDGHRSQATVEAMHLLKIVS